MACRCQLRRILTKENISRIGKMQFQPPEISIKRQFQTHFLLHWKTT